MLDFKPKCFRNVGNKRILEVFNLHEFAWFFMNKSGLSITKNNKNTLFYLLTFINSICSFK